MNSRRTCRGETTAKSKRKAEQQDDIHQRLKPAELAARCTDAGEPITEQQIRKLIERGQLLDSAGTLSLTE